MYQKLFVFGALLLATSSVAQTKPEPVAVGEKVPDFVVQDLRGKTRKLSELQKESPSGLVSLTFWCSFCHSCRHMEARLDQMAKSMHGKAVVAAVDASAGETAEGVSAFVKQKGLTVPVLMDGKGAAADLFGVRVTTTTVVIDGKGILRYRGRFADGSQPHAENALQAVLAGKNVPKAETALQG
jgi:peroxiredoxin